MNTKPNRFSSCLEINALDEHCSGRAVDGKKSAAKLSAVYSRLIARGNNGKVKCFSQVALARTVVRSLPADHLPGQNHHLRRSMRTNCLVHMAIHLMGILST